MHMKTVAIINQKGGVGKSTTAMALGAGLAGRGQRVLFVDLDPQGNLSYSLQADLEQPGALEMLTQPGALVIQNSPGGEVVAASPSLAGADTIITATGKEYRLKEALNRLAASQKYDYALIDTPPALGVLTVNALTAAQGLVIPAQADAFSLQGIGQLSQTIEAVRQYCNPSLKILGILLTRHNNRSILSRDLAEAVGQTAGHLKTRLFQTAIREAVAVREAQAQRVDLFQYAPKCNAALDYQDFIDEFLSLEF